MSTPPASPSPVATTNSARSASAASTSLRCSPRPSNRSKYYFMERDPVGIGGPTNFNPFVNTANSMKAMRADPSPMLYAGAPVFTSVAAGTTGAANQVPVVVTNDGDAPLTITNITVAADANDGGAATAADFQIVSQNCFGTGNVGPLAPRQARGRRRPGDAGQRGLARRPVGHLHGQRRLQADAHQLRVSRPSAVHVEFRRLGRARAARRQEHWQCPRNHRRQRRQRADAEPLQHRRQLRHLRAGGRPHLRHGARRHRDLDRRRRGPLGRRTSTRRHRAAWSTARSRCRRRSRLAPPPPRPRTRPTPRPSRALR